MPTLHTNTIIHGDCLAAMRQLPAGSIDAIITDPPLAPFPPNTLISTQERRFSAAFWCARL